MRHLIFVLIYLLTISIGLAADTCSRIAVINLQEVLVDISSSQKGEGLRFYLERDPIAKKYLEDYQKGTETKWSNALLGTIGSALLLSTIFSTGTAKSKNALAITGGAFIAINFLVAETNEYKNEVNLQQAIEEYNKRNFPRIIFDPLAPEGERPSTGSGFMINFSRGF